MGSAVVAGDRAHTEVTTTLAGRFGAAAVALTDSGTSALVLAMRLTAGAGGTVALPAYGCIDLTAAAVFAGVRVRLYDIDPTTLSPDLESVARTVSRGVDAIVVVHFYGYPADVPGVARLAAEAGVSVIEDAAQGSGGTLDGTRLGALAPLSILSFGRGKGITGGRGGALLLRDPELAVRAESLRLGRPPRGWRDATIATAQWLLGRPSLYALPASLPMLRLGEMVYHPAKEPSSLSHAAAALVRDALTYDDVEADLRRRNADAMLKGTEGTRGIEPVHVIARRREWLSARRGLQPRWSADRGATRHGDRLPADAGGAGGAPTPALRRRARASRRSGAATYSCHASDASLPVDARARISYAVDSRVGSLPSINWSRGGSAPAVSHSHPHAP